MAYDPDAATIGADVAALVRQMGAHLAGKHPALQGAALADLLATWLAGHLVKRDPTATQQLRDDMLEEHIRLVRLLLEINAKAIHGPEDTPHADPA